MIRFREVKKMARPKMSSKSRLNTFVSGRPVGGYQSNQRDYYDTLEYTSSVRAGGSGSSAG